MYVFLLFVLSHGELLTNCCFQLKVIRFDPGYNRYENIIILGFVPCRFSLSVVLIMYKVKPWSRQAHSCRGLIPVSVAWSG